MEHKRHIGFEIKTTSNMIRRFMSSNPVLADSDRLTGMHSWIIGYLYDESEKGDVFQRDIEANFTIRRSTASGILQLMEKNGLIIRESVDYDARLKKLVLTPKAKALHERVMREFDAIEARLSKDLTEAELNAFYSTMEKIRKNIE